MTLFDVLFDILFPTRHNLILAGSPLLRGSAIRPSSSIILYTVTISILVSIVSIDLLPSRKHGHQITCSSQLTLFRRPCYTLTANWRRQFLLLFESQHLLFYPFHTFIECDTISYIVFERMLSRNYERKQYKFTVLAENFCIGSISCCVHYSVLS